MAKFYGIVGFMTPKDNGNGVWADEIVEQKYFGDIVKSQYGYSYQSSGNLNDDITVSNDISIIADSFANEHYSAIRFVELNGTRWKVTSVSMQYPRLVLSIGGVYNG